jgi:hypothetical protein
LASLKPLKKRAGSGSGSGAGTQVESEEVVPEGVHLRDCPAAGLDVYEESLHGSVRVVDRQVEVQLSKKKHIFAMFLRTGLSYRN